MNSTKQQILTPGDMITKEQIAHLAERMNGKRLPVHKDGKIIGYAYDLQPDGTMTIELTEPVESEKPSCQLDKSE